MFPFFLNKISRQSFDNNFIISQFNTFPTSLFVKYRSVKVEIVDIIVGHQNLN